MNCTNDATRFIYEKKCFFKNSPQNVKYCVRCGKLIFFFICNLFPSLDLFILHSVLCAIIWCTRCKTNSMCVCVCLWESVRAISSINTCTHTHTHTHRYCMRSATSRAPSWADCYFSYSIKVLHSLFSIETCIWCAVCCDFCTIKCYEMEKKNWQQQQRQQHTCVEHRKQKKKRHVRSRALLWY